MTAYVGMTLEITPTPAPAVADEVLTVIQSRTSIDAIFDVATTHEVDVGGITYQCSIWVEHLNDVEEDWDEWQTESSPATNEGASDA